MLFYLKILKIFDIIFIQNEWKGKCDMAKGWTLVGTNAFEFGNFETKQERVRRERKSNNVIRNTAKSKYEDLMKESMDAAMAKTQHKTQLVEALDQGRLKSKRLIAEAEMYKKPVTE